MFPDFRFLLYPFFAHDCMIFFTVWDLNTQWFVIQAICQATYNLNNKLLVCYSNGDLNKKYFWVFMGRGQRLKIN